jgi:hypothetical protein
MANNRMWLVCVECLATDGTDPEDCRFFLAKYYPSTGWYTTREGKLDTEINEWLDKHIHGDMFGEYIVMVYESVFGGAGEDKRRILTAIAEQMTRVQGDNG